MRGWLRKRFDRDRIEFKWSERVRTDIEKFDEVQTIIYEVEVMFDEEMMSREVLEGWL
jgi:hypothetical protein